MRKIVMLFCAVALVLVTTLALAGDAQTVNGYITDAKCGAKGAHAGMEGCAKKCIGAGSPAVVVTDGDQKVLTIDNPDAIKGHEGHHVAVTGQISGDKIHVDSLKMI